MNRYTQIHLKDNEHNYKFYLNHYFVIMKLFNVEMAPNFEVILEQTPLRAEFCNSVQYSVFVNYSTH
jgi:hypothetical protein